MIHNGLGGAPGGLIAGTQQTATPFRGGILYAQPENIVKFRLSGPNGVPGMGSHTLFYNGVPPQAVGVTFYLQAGYLDPGAPGGVSMTDGIEATL